ncbi:nucleoside hydrolase [Microbacterium sp. gxy059]|uniref:nucleoside hydrolase n=1 Tax=Microbacterium sp. gxy059 TaxID=2957199 RepID=UPI003D981AB2
MPASAPLYVDCDTGIDDALALAYLLARDARIVGIGTVPGNVAAAAGARNTLDLLEVLGAPPIPVAVGCEGFTTHRFAPRPGARVHGANGIGDVALPPSSRQADPRHAVSLLGDLARSHPGELRILALGSVTNLAAALAEDPELPRLVRDVTIMGGAALAPGNITPAAEANIAHDPEAAASVLAAGWGVTLVPLDVTMRQRLTAAQTAELRATGDAGLVAVADILEHYLDFYGARYGERAAALHDPLAAAVLLGDVPLSLAAHAAVVVDTTDGPGRGQTIVDLRDIYGGFRSQDPSHPRIALRIDADFGAQLVETLLRWRGSGAPA